MAGRTAEAPRREGATCGPRHRTSSRSSQRSLWQPRRPRRFFEPAVYTTVEAELQEAAVANGEAKFTWHTESKVSREVLERIRALPGVVRAWNVPFRPGLRHEAATALALWYSYYRMKHRGFPALSIYLCAAHHGKVRTVLTSRSDGGEDVCGIPKTVAALPWKEMPLDFACAVDGASGRFSEDESDFIFDAPGWSGLVADLLGAWESDAARGRQWRRAGRRTAQSRAVRARLSRDPGALR